MIIVSYVDGHGWRMPRLAWWTVMMLTALMGGGLAGAVDVVLRFATGLEHVPFSLVVPVCAAIVARRRLRRIKARGVVLVDPLLTVWMHRVHVVRADLEPQRFARWLLLEQCMLITIVAAWSLTPISLLFAR